MNPFSSHHISRFCLICAVGFLAGQRLQPASAQPSDDTEWSVGVLNQLLAPVPPGQALVRVGDMEVPAAYLRWWSNKLAGGAQTFSAFNGGFTAWPGGNVYYTFSNNVSVLKQRAFLDGAAEWAMFAGLHFVPRTSEANYVTIYEDAALSGGQSAVGMVGGQQFLRLGPNAWNRATICHELGHTLGLVHEHQRSDRNAYVTILTNNILPGAEANFVLLTGSQNHGAYDFLSVMHYGRNTLSTNTASDTIVPLPAYNQYLDIMGNRFDPVLSAADRAGMAAVYGAGPNLTSVVTNTLDSGPGSVRAALYYAFDHPGTTITFNIPLTDAGYSNNVFNIQPTDTLPGLWGFTTLDASTEPTNSNPAGPEILLDGILTRSLPVYPNGLRFRGTNCTARSLIINNFPACGVLLDGSNTIGNTVSGCYLGIDPTGIIAVTNGFVPVKISGGAASNTVGGTTAAARNIISGSAYHGLLIQDAGTRNNVVAGNHIGLNATGTAALPNNWSGVDIFGSAAGNIIGPANTISGNPNYGVVISSTGSDHNTVQGNFIGLDATGTAPVPNAWAGIGIFSGAKSNLVGGTIAAARNVISGNGSQGVVIGDSGTTANRVQGNYIGLNPAGTAAMGNSWAGVNLYGGASGNLIGGDAPGTGNVIAGNSFQGVLIQDAGTDGNFVQGNLIGLDAAGGTAVANGWTGVEIYNGPASNRIGGYGGARNFISGNGNYGLSINYGSSGNIIQGNTIGLNAASGAATPNTWAAVAIFEGAQSNLVGGISLGAANLISAGTGDGVELYDAGTTNNTIRGNSIFNNAYAGIGLYYSANLNLAAPSLAAASVTTSTVVTGTYTGTSGKVYQLDFYADAPPAATAEAMTYLGSTNVTGTGGSAGFTVKLGARLPAGRAVTATATDPAGNTSRLSAGVAATMTSTPNDGIPDAWRLLYFGSTSTNSSSYVAGDPDHDGLNNDQEFLAGTNPTNAASVFKLTAFNPATSTNAVSIHSANGIVYRVQCRDDLGTGAWAILADQVAGNGTNVFLADPGASAISRRFYRAQVLW